MMLDDACTYWLLLLGGRSYGGLMIARQGTPLGYDDLYGYIQGLRVGR